MVSARPFAIVDGVEDVPARLHGGVVAIGNFDGLHRGHRAVLDTAWAIAERDDRPALVLSFEPHPRTYFRPDEPVFPLTPRAEKARLVAEAGFDALVLLRFDAALAAMTAGAFVDGVLHEALKARHLVAGEDFHFGARREGTPQFLETRAGLHGISVTLVPPLREGEPISSSRIRSALAAGDTATATRLLGRPWRASGLVIEGQKLGRQLGFPTANLRLPAGTELRHGIYAAIAILPDGTRQPAVVSHGRRPTVEADGAELTEVWVLDWSGDLYGQELAVDLVAFLRPEERFDGLDALTAQVMRDAEDARAALAGAL